MFTKKRNDLLAIMLIILPILVYYYLSTYRTEISNHGDFHFYYVIISSIIAFLLGFAAYLEYKKSKVEKIFYISIGLIGVGVFYTFHALVTPNMTIVKLFEFPDIVNNISVFVLFGDLSRLWLAIMMFVPDNFFERNNQIKKYFNGYTLIIIAIILTGSVYYGLLTPEVFPVFTNADFSNTNFAILTKIVTLLFIGMNVLRYYYSYKAKSNIVILFFIVGLGLIMETVIVFMISKPWSSSWWLAHNLFLASYIVIGFGVMYSYFSKEKYGFFDVFGQIEKYTKLLEEKNLELNTIANCDSLTGLSNRRHFMMTAQEYIKEAEAVNGTFTLMFIDLDHFKTINDKYGHETGDQLLKIISKKISSLIKSTDIASRVGGDEFVLLIKNVTQTQFEDIATRILDRVTEPIVIGGNICHVGASIGISTFPNDGSTIDDLLSKSDEAMYSVKKEGRNNYKIAT
jgi:diguanylate cyclase (GGDEF)-like protein